MRVVVSELSGRGNVLAKAEEMGVTVTAGVEVEALREIKEAENRGLSYEGAEASIRALAATQSGRLRAAISSDRLSDPGRQTPRHRDLRRGRSQECRSANKPCTPAAGQRPGGAHSTARCARRSRPLTPRFNEIHLADYKVRILDGTEGTEAITRVLIDSQDAHRSWSTVGALVQHHRSLDARAGRLHRVRPDSRPCGVARWADREPSSARWRPGRRPKRARRPSRSLGSAQCAPASIHDVMTEMSLAANGGLPNGICLPLKQPPS